MRPLLKVWEAWLKAQQWGQWGRWKIVRKCSSLPFQDHVTVWIGPWKGNAKAAKAAKDWEIAKDWKMFEALTQDHGTWKRPKAPAIARSIEENNNLVKTPHQTSLFSSLSVHHSLAIALLICFAVVGPVLDRDKEGYCLRMLLQCPNSVAKFQAAGNVVKFVECHQEHLPGSRSEKDSRWPMELYNLCALNACLIWNKDHCSEGGNARVGCPINLSHQTFLVSCKIRTLLRTKSGSGKPGPALRRAWRWTNWSVSGPAER